MWNSSYIAWDPATLTVGLAAAAGGAGGGRDGGGSGSGQSSNPRHASCIGQTTGSGESNLTHGSEPHDAKSGGGGGGGIGDEGGGGAGNAR